MRDLDPTIGRRTATDRRQHVQITVDFFTDDNKFDHVTDPLQRAAALTVHGASIGMAKKQGSDGHVRPEQVLAKTRLADFPEIAKILIADGVWHQADHGCPRCPQPHADHVYVHDYLEHNRTAAQERRTTERRRANGAKGLSSRWGERERPVEGPRRPPGRPRKHPLPTPGTETIEMADSDGVVLVPVPRTATEPILQHPAELAARNRRGARPARTEPKTFDPIVLELCEELAALVERNGFSVGKIGPAWWVPCEQLLRIGPPNAKQAVTPQQIRDAMNWMNNDAFWWENVRCMKQLRERYEQLRSAAKNPNRPKRGQLGVRPSGRSSQPPAAVGVSGVNALYAADNAHMQRKANPDGR